MSDEENPEFFFREEAYDLLSELESTLLELDESPDDLDMLNRVLSALHTIKVSGAMFGFDDIAHFTHDLGNGGTLALILDVPRLVRSVISETSNLQHRHHIDVVKNTSRTNVLMALPMDCPGIAIV